MPDLKLASLCLPLLVWCAPVLARDDRPKNGEQPISSDSKTGEILVIANRINGQLDVPQEPITTLSELDVQALGASSISDLLSLLAPQVGSGRGRGDGHPYVLVNGQRITSFREMRNYPPEAIRKVEVLPEEVALRLGYPADARVVNLVLKDNYANRRLELDYGLPTRGGFAEWEGEVTVLRINGPKRIVLTATATDRSPLFEAERDVVLPASAVSTVTGDPNPTQFRSLIADSRDFAFNVALTSGLGKDGLGGSFSLNAAVDRADSRSWQGLDVVRLVDPGGSAAVRVLADPLQRTSRTSGIQGGAGFAGSMGNWQFNSTLDATYSKTETLTDRRADTTGLVAAALAGTLPIGGTLPALPAAGQDASSVHSIRVEGLATLTGAPFRLPAGDVAVTVKAGFTTIDFDSEDQRSNAGPVSLNRFRKLGGINLALPLASRREHVLGAVGNLTLNLGMELSDLSDFGAVNSWNAGLTWGPAEKLVLQASYLFDEAAPSISQLGAPQTVTANVPVFDFVTGQTALVAMTDGGNPGLRKEARRDLKLGATWQLPVLSGSTAVIEFIRNRSSRVSAAFPLLTPQVEAAFPDRVTRDAGGRLVAIDARPVTFAEQSSSRIRWGFTLGDSIGKAPPGRGGRNAVPGGIPGPRPGSSGSGRPAGAGGGGRMMAMMMGGGQGRWSLGAYHTMQLTSRILIAPGVPALDLLDGDALSTSGTPRHAIEFNGGLFHKGKGIFVQGTWSAPNTLAATGLPGSSDLRFGALTKANVNLFVEMGDQGKLAQKSAVFKGLRLSLRIENLFDSRRKVTDANGLVPLSYQADYLDPRGRVIEFELRKIF